MKHPRSRFSLFVLVALLVLVFTLTAAIAYAKPDKDAEKSIGDLEYLGMVTFETGTMFQGTEVGGLSGITYDASRGVYYAVSDDRSQINDARYYTVAIDASDYALEEDDVEFLSYTILLDENGEPFATNMVDAEGITLRASGQIFISSEWRTGFDPFVKRFDWEGEQTATLPIPEKFMPADESGMEANFSFESLAITPNDKVLWTASEAALKQDGAPSSPTSDSPARMIMFDAPKRRPMGEHVYVVEAIPNPPPDPERPEPRFPPDNGLVELVTVDNAGTLIAMERSYWDYYGNTVRLFEVKTEGASDVAGYFTLADSPSYTPVSKRQLLELTPDTTPRPDNLEGATFGPLLPDGRYLLILISDNNFGDTQTTQFIAYAVEVE